MAHLTIGRLRKLIRALNYVVSAHAAEELDDDNLSILDLEISSSRGRSSSASVTQKPTKAKLSSPASFSTEVGRKPSSRSASAASSSSSPSMSSDRLCAHCGSSAVQIRHVTRSFGKAASLLVIEAIPMYSCPDCGESYFSAQTLHEIERIKSLRKSVAVSRSVPVASFQPLAA